MSERKVTPGDISLATRELVAVLTAAEQVDGEEHQMPLYWAAHRLAAELYKMAKALECVTSQVSELQRAAQQ